MTISNFFAITQKRSSDMRKTLEIVKNYVIWSLLNDTRRLTSKGIQDFLCWYKAPHSIVFKIHFPAAVLVLLNFSTRFPFVIPLHHLV